jgi:hypothetical protein
VLFWKGLKKSLPRHVHFLNSGTGTELYSEIFTRLRTLFNTGLDRLKMYIFRGGKKVAPKGMYILFKFWHWDRIVFPSVTYYNVLKILWHFHMVITGISVRICIMNLFNTGLNKLQFRVLKTLMYLYTPGVYGRDFMGGHPDRSLWEGEGGEGGWERCRHWLPAPGGANC